MGDFEDKLSAMMGNPAAMEKIMALARSLEDDNTPPEKEKAEDMPPLPQIDPSALQALYGLAGQSGIDKNQKSLLSALSPYISSNRIAKLERAMRAAKLAGIATTMLGR